MLRRLKVRTRLMAVIALPLILLLTVVVPELLQRRDRAADADRATVLAGEASTVAAATDALEGERLLSAALRAGSGSVASALTAARTTTDGAVERVETSLARLAERAPELRASASRAGGLLDALDAARAETAAARSTLPWDDPYTPLIDALLAVQEDLGSVVAGAGVGDELVQVGLIGRTKEAAAAQSSQLAAALSWGELRGDQGDRLRGLRADELAYRNAYLAATPPSARSERRSEVQAGAVTTAGRLVEDLIADEDLDPLGSLADWLDLAGARQVVLRDLESARIASALHQVGTLGDEARRESSGYAALAALGLLLASAVALLAARSITRPLRQLTDAAGHLAAERLPMLVDALRHPGEEDEHYLAATLERIDVGGSDDELADLGRAFNAVQAVAVDVAAEQAHLLRKGISDLYVNLARRNQALIERQIHLLDQLEVGEQDPETLEHLYLLDHLATRMRRNAESLLVLAGAESGTRRTKPVGIVDVVRAAVSEVEDYERIDLGALAPATLQGPAVSDVAHIVAELLENATHFSPPDTTVRIDGARTGGSYQIVISDRGVGIGPDQMDALNAVLRDPPVTGLALGRSLGCLVAARLAARHGITVRLRPGEREGVAAYVILPRHLIAEEAAPPLAPPAPDTFVVLSDEPEEPTVVAPPPAPASRLRDVLPSAASFDADLQALLEGAAPPALVEPPVHLEPRRLLEPPPAPPAAEPAAPPVAQPAPEPAGSLAPWAEWDSPAPAAAALGAPVADRVTPPLPTVEDLVRRVPGATAPPAPTHTGPGGTRRSPDEVRALLSRYRSGLRAGRAVAPPSDPVAEEGS